MIFHFYRNPNYLKSLLQFPKIFLLPSQPHFHSRQITCHNCRWPHAIQVHQIHRSVEAVAVMVHRVWHCGVSFYEVLAYETTRSGIISSVLCPASAASHAGRFLQKVMVLAGCPLSGTQFWSGFQRHRSHKIALIKSALNHCTYLIFTCKYPFSFIIFSISANCFISFSIEIVLSVTIIILPFEPRPPDA